MNLSKTLSLVIGVLILSACGSQSSSTLGGTTSANSTSSSSTTSTSSGSGNYNNQPNAASQYVQLSGNNGGAFSKTLYFQTSRTLKVKVNALSAPNLTINGYTNWVFPYGCMSVSITVNGVTRTSGVMQVPGVTQTSSQCMNAASSAVIDFSDITTGNGPITVTYNNAQYDNCRYYNPMAYGCVLSTVWQNHQVAFNTTVQTDGTYMQ